MSPHVDSRSANFPSQAETELKSKHFEFEAEQTFNNALWLISPESWDYSPNLGLVLYEIVMFLF